MLLLILIPYRWMQVFGLHKTLLVVLNMLLLILIPYRWMPVFGLHKTLTQVAL